MPTRLELVGPEQPETQVAVFLLHSVLRPQQETNKIKLVGDARIQFCQTETFPAIGNVGAFGLLPMKSVQYTCNVTTPQML